ncbi:beta-ketoacyl synthase N-terminal-like domain-containing protein [Streptomyces eurythermus]|uniref:beta-ketoacyl synthase N-terminal-like domain-containing protein n=1 Tax=Streptomyces eurythermus TaxID=42237 RepID=UPI003F4D5A0A
MSHALGLRGPSPAVDPGCSAGLVAAHLAGRRRLFGEYDLALSGAVHVLLGPWTPPAYEGRGVPSCPRPGGVVVSTRTWTAASGPRVVSCLSSNIWWTPSATASGCWRCSPVPL